MNAAHVAVNMHKPLLVAGLLVSLLLAGCASSDGGDTTPAASYTVPIKGAHNVNGDDRTITLKVTQDGKELGSGTYSTAGQAASEGTKDSDFKSVFSVKAAAGPVKIQVFEGNNPLNFKSIDPAKCTGPDFKVHVIDDAVHLWSNCD